MENDSGAIRLCFITNAVCGKVNDFKLRERFRFQCRFGSIWPLKDNAILSHCSTGIGYFLFAEWQGLHIGTPDICYSAHLGGFRRLFRSWTEGNT